MLALLRLALPGLVQVADDEIIALDDPHLDIPPHPREADYVVSAGPADIFHVEGQGYRDADFAHRVFAYHLTLGLRFPERTVHTFAVWMRPPPLAQRLATVERGNVTIRVATVVLSELPAALLLSVPETACFAMAAEIGSMAIDELADLVVRALARPGAHPQERAMAGVAAITRGRYDAFMRAMERAKMEPVIIEDLVDYGYDLGVAEGIETGALAAVKAALVAVLAARSIPTTPEIDARVGACDDPSQLQLWLRRAAVAHSAAEVFRDD